MGTDASATHITAESILDEARARAQLDDFGDGEYQAPFAAWVEDLNGPQLSDFGRAFLRRLIVRDLVRRLRLVDTLKQQPAIERVKLPKIIFVTGFPRTGTTLLHNLLALRDGSRALLRWELMDPTPPPEAASYQTDPRIARLQQSLEPLRGGVLERMHWVNADEPEECTWGYWDCTGLLGRGCKPSMPTWNRWIEISSARPTFVGYRKLVQLLLYRNPMRDDGVLVLKNPVSTWSIDEFASVFPEAQFVVTHRDPYRSLISMCTVTDAINTPFAAGGTSPLRDNALREDSFIAWYRRGAEVLERFDATHPGRALHVRYGVLTSQAAATVQCAYDHAGASTDSGLPARIDAFLQKQRSGHRASPPDAYETYGYDHDATWSDATLARYCARYGVVKERTRVADAAR